MTSSKPVSADRYRHATQYALSGELQEARLHYEMLQSDTTDGGCDARIVNDLGCLAAVAGDDTLAFQHLSDAAELDPNCEPAQHNLRVLAGHTRIGEQCVPGKRSPCATQQRSRKVAIISFLFNWPSMGGGIIHTVELARFLEHAGYCVKLFHPRYDPWQIGRADTTCPFPSTGIEFHERDWNVETIRDRFRAAVDDFAPDCVLITDTWNFKPHLAEAMRGYRVFLRMQAMECLCPLNNLRLLQHNGGPLQCENHQFVGRDQCMKCLRHNAETTGPLHLLERELSRVGSEEYHSLLLRSFREAEAVLVLNRTTGELIRPYARDVRVITWGMDPARFPWLPSAENHAITNDRDRIHSLFFAGLPQEPIKGFSALVAACRKLWPKRRDFQLLATGDPHNGFNDRFIRYVGWLAQSELPTFYRYTDITVVPTIAQEGLSRTAVEAMASGRPVIASRIGGLIDTISDGETGLFAKPGDADDWAERIEYLLDRPDLRKEMGLAGRREFEARFRWPTVIERDYRPLLDAESRSEQAEPGVRASTPRSNNSVQFSHNSEVSTSQLGGQSCR